jgi:outer membrane receptor for ferrienterochelin and colicin
MAALPAGRPPVRFVVGNPNLEPEELVNVDFGYRGKLFEMVHADITLFAQDVSKLTGNVPENVIPVYKINRFDYQQLGLETGFKVYPTSILSTYINYAFVYTVDKNTKQHIKEFPMHIAGLGAELRLPWRTRLNLDSYWVFTYRPYVSAIVSDAIIPLTTNENRDAANQIVINLRIGHLFFNDQLEAYLMGKNLVGFFSGPEDLRMYPLNSVQPIGGTVMVGLNLNTF